MIRPILYRSLALALLISSSVQAASPSMTAVRPVGGQRGTELEINLTGVRLADAKEIFFYQPGITTTKITVVADNHVKALIKIAPDAPLGIHDFRLRTGTGVSELRTFSVGVLPEVSEVEPNNDFIKPQVVPFGIVVNGVAENEDVDYFAVEVKKGQRITAEVEGVRLGITTFDPYVAIMDSKRFELASSDDSALVWQDGVASIIAPADGTYIIQVRESAYAGNGACLYRLHIGEFPRATATLPGGGKIGEAVEVTWLGDVMGNRVTKTTLPGALDRNFGLVAQDEKGSSPHPNAFRLSPFGNLIEQEPNNDQATANVFVAPIALNGVIEKPGDIDHYVFTAKKGQAYEVRVFARAIRSPLDPVLYIAKKGQGNFAGNDDSAGPDSYLRLNCDQDIEYVISIIDHLQKGGPDYAYRIEVSPVEAKLNLNVASEALVRGTGNIAISVPKGNRQAILVNAGRENFGGELALSAANLPPGVVLEADPMAANLGTMPILLVAQPDAVVGGSLIKLQGKPTDPKVVVPSEFTHTVEMTNGQNNVPVWTRVLDTLPVAVTEEAPYSIEIVEPKVPLVRGGSMNLKVRATRKPDFKAAIAISLPWNPPGVGSAGGIAIPEGQTEAVIPINADGGAELKTWRIVVNGYSSIASGPIYVSSQLAKLTISPQYVTFGYQAVSVEQGKEIDLPIAITKAIDFEGPATVNLIGLPNKATTTPMTITKDLTSLIFKVKTDLTTPAGNHNQLFCQVVVTQNGEPIVHNLGTGTLRVDVPLPPKPNAAPAPMPMPAAVPPPTPPPTAVPPKPLTRLEKLRKETQDRNAAAQGQPK